MAFAVVPLVDVQVAAIAEAFLAVRARKLLDWIVGENVPLAVGIVVKAFVAHSAKVPGRPKVDVHNRVRIKTGLIFARNTAFTAIDEDGMRHLHVLRGGCSVGKFRVAHVAGPSPPEFMPLAVPIEVARVAEGAEACGA